MLTKARDQWAETTSANKDVKIHFWAVAGHDGPGYVDAGTLTRYIGQAQGTWSSFGGVTLWEASLAISLYGMSDVTMQ